MELFGYHGVADLSAPGDWSLGVVGAQDHCGVHVLCGRLAACDQVDCLVDEHRHRSTHRTGDDRPCCERGGQGAVRGGVQRLPAPVIPEDAPAGLAAQATVCHELALELRWRVTFVAARLLPHRGPHGETHVLPDEIGELHRPHPETAELAHRPVDRGGIGNPGLDHPLGFAIERSGDPVDDEAGRGGAAHRGLAPSPHELNGRSQGLIGGLVPVDHLNQTHQRRRVEEVQPQHAFRVGHFRRDRGDIQARGVAGE